jgi:polysaccharide biosynthesis/export protein
LRNFFHNQSFNPIEFYVQWLGLRAAKPYICMNIKMKYILLLLVTGALFSCVSPKKVIFFNDLSTKMSDSSLYSAKINFESKIQKNDQLAITVGGSNQQDLLTINSANGMQMGAGGGVAIGTSVFGYLVEADGKIQLPYIGKTQAEGLTRIELEKNLAIAFANYTKNPIVNIRFINYGFSVLGEVRNPGRFLMSSERTTIIEALGLAGDFSEFGRRDNVLIVREENGQRIFARINFLSGDLFKSPYFYLRTNDVVYVEPVQSKFIARSGVPQYLAIMAVGLSLVLTIINVSR